MEFNNDAYTTNGPITGISMAMSFLIPPNVALSHLITYYGEAKTREWGGCDGCYNLYTVCNLTMPDKIVSVTVGEFETTGYGYVSPGTKVGSLSITTENGYFCGTQRNPSARETVVTKP